MLIIIGLLLGLLFGLFANILVPASLVPYLAVFTLVGIEALTGSWKALREGDFAADRFLLEFGANSLVAFLMTALGTQLKYDFSLLVAFIFAYRIFRNISYITRWFYLKLKARTHKEGSPLVEEEQVSEEAGELPL